MAPVSGSVAPLGFNSDAEADGVKPKAEAKEVTLMRGDRKNDPTPLEPEHTLTLSNKQTKNIFRNKRIDYGHFLELKVTGFFLPRCSELERPLPDGNAGVDHGRVVVGRRVEVVVD